MVDCRELPDLIQRNRATIALTACTRPSSSIRSKGRERKTTRYSVRATIELFTWRRYPSLKRAVTRRTSVPWIDISHASWSFQPPCISLHDAIAWPRSFATSCAKVSQLNGSGSPGRRAFAFTVSGNHPFRVSDMDCTHLEGNQRNLRYHIFPCNRVPGPQCDGFVVRSFDFAAISQPDFAWLLPSATTSRS